MKPRHLSLLALLAINFHAYGVESCSTVPTGWQLSREKTSDGLCADILQKNDEDGTRRLRIFDAGRLELETDDAALCVKCGGTLGDPFQGIEWKDRTLWVSNEGGSRETWGETWKLAKRGQRWVLIGWERNSKDRLTGSVWLESVNALSGKANAELQPGHCDAKEECGENKPSQPKKLACTYPAKSPDAQSIPQWRDKPYACGLGNP